MDLLTDATVEATAEPSLDSAPAKIPEVASAGATASAACLRGGHIRRDAQAEQE